MACDRLLSTTNLLQAVNRHVASWLQILLSTGLLQVVSTTGNKSANDKFATSLILTDLLQLDELVDKLQTTFEGFPQIMIEASFILFAQFLLMLILEKEENRSTGD